MPNLPALIRTVRISQGILQSKLAEHLGINQASIARYETMKSTLSLDTLVLAAVFLNMNPDYIEKGLGNPFKASDPSKAIKMIIPDSIGGAADLELLNFVLQASEYPMLLMLKPEGKRDLRWRDQSFSLLVRDEDENTFIFRRKNAGSTFYDRHIQSLAREATKISSGYCEMRSLFVNESVYENIRSWSDLDAGTIRQILEEKQRARRSELRPFFGMLMQRMREYSTSREDRKKIDLLIEKFAKLRPDQLELIRERILPQYEEILINESLNIS